MDTLEHLNETLVARKGNDPSTSYVASLYQGGVNKIAQKVGEEATEVVLAAKDAASDADHKPALVAEFADVWFHSLVLLNHLGLGAYGALTAAKVNPRQPDGAAEQGGIPGIKP